jgi:hypothetical protein
MSILNLDRPVEPVVDAVASPAPGAPATGAAAMSPAPVEPQGSGENLEEYEFVLGRRQLAGTGLILVVVLALFSGVSYVIGRSMPARPSITQAEVLPLPPAVLPPPEPVLVSPALPEPQEQVKINSAAPLFAQAVTGQVYLQIGVVEKGLAAIWAEGLRTHGLNAFVAPGPGDNLWRVLIGPLPDPQAYQRAKDVLDTLGITTFGRRYQQ